MRFSGKFAARPNEASSALIDLNGRRLLVQRYSYVLTIYSIKQSCDALALRIPMQPSSPILPPLYPNSCNHYYTAPLEDGASSPSNPIQTPRCLTHRILPRLPPPPSLAYVLQSYHPALTLNCRQLNAFQIHPTPLVVDDQSVRPLL